MILYIKDEDNTEFSINVDSIIFAEHSNRSPNKTLVRFSSGICLFLIMGLKEFTLKWKESLNENRK